ncbi:MAG TPA: FtsH protease activity modulator HflK [Rhizomicrobium sp.]|jgi:modulator of FtsH protease HflK|nr:FtsH protease activity modulator HflK [Rhizomicrobium sp.]
MPWTNQTGGNGPTRGPWGRPPQGGGGGNRPPDLEELLRRSQERLRGILPGGFTTGSLLILLLGIVVVWLFSGFYFVGAREQGIVLRFGKYVARTAPGLNYHLPWPIETVETPEVTRENQINIGYGQVTDTNGQTNTEDLPEESLMLTGDENIVDVNFTVYWVIKDAGAFLFNVENPQDNPDAVIKAVAESAMREVVGQNQIERILTQDREPVQIQVRNLMQKTLDEYGAGVTVTRVQMQKVDPPLEVISAYRDVQAARADQERLRNEAEAYANKIIPEARGQAARIVQEAQAYKQQVIAEASGEAKRFVSVYDEYRKAPDVTRKRMYLETMSRLLAPMSKVIVDENAAKNIIPYLPPQALGKSAPENVTVTAPSAAVPSVSNADGSGQ